MLYKKLQKIWHYIKCVIICKQEIGYGSKRKFRKSYNRIMWRLKKLQGLIYSCQDAEILKLGMVLPY